MIITEIGNFIVGYLTLGMIGWVLLIFWMAIKTTCTFLKLNITVEDPAVDKILRGGHSDPWYILTVQFVIWPYGFIKVIKRHEKLEQKLIDQVKESRTFTENGS